MKNVSALPFISIQLNCADKTHELRLSIRPVFWSGVKLPWFGSLKSMIEEDKALASAPKCSIAAFRWARMLVRISKGFKSFDLSPMHCTFKPRVPWESAIIYRDPDILPMRVSTTSSRTPRGVALPCPKESPDTCKGHLSLGRTPTKSKIH